MAKTKYDTGDVVFYLGRTKCTVLSNALKGGGVNIDEAVIFLKSAQGSSLVIPVKHQDQFLSERQISMWQKWPLAASVNR